MKVKVTIFLPTTGPYTKVLDVSASEFERLKADLKRQGYIEAVGHTRSGVPTNHGRIIWIYRMTEEGRRYLESVLEGTD